MNLIVISTGFSAPTKSKCIQSVRMQTEKNVHYYVEAGPEGPANMLERDGRGKCALENFVAVARTIDPQDILVSLDGDDWFPHEHVLSTLAKVYADPLVWMTYGSFRYADGRPGFAAPYTTEDFRGSPWQATHLKTFRAGLFQMLDDQDVKTSDGKYRDLCWDMATMFPLLEMSGLEHSRFIPEILYVYNYAHAWEHNASPDERAREKAMNQQIRSLPRRTKLEAL